MPAATKPPTKRKAKPKLGRPPRDTATGKPMGKFFGLRLTKTESDKLEALAKQFGMSRTAALRELILRA
jgi:hypothetical protein